MVGYMVSVWGGSMCACTWGGGGGLRRRHDFGCFRLFSGLRPFSGSVDDGGWWMLGANAGFHGMLPRVGEEDFSRGREYMLLLRRSADQRSHFLAPFG